jgi:hypothetical protein
MNHRIALVTCAQFSGLSEDDRHLQSALRSRGIDAVPVVWTEAAPDWSSFDLALIRSTWDYHRRYDEFLRWFRETSEGVTLWNPSEVLVWNTHKTYLRDLAATGVPTVPTAWGRSTDDLCRAAGSRAWGRVVVKPSVSANAERTVLLDSPDLIDGLSLEDRGRDGWMVQPYVDEVEGRGERSLIFLDGRFSHAAQRKAALNPDVPLVDGAAVEAAPGELETARQALSVVPGPWLYARADLVTTPDGTARVMELELVEPFLYFRAAPQAAEAFAATLARMLR